MPATSTAASTQPSASEAAALETERLKSALWHTVGRHVDELLLDPASTLNLPPPDHTPSSLSSLSTSRSTHRTTENVNATPQFIGALAELAWAQLESAAVDVERFAQHAGRRMVKVEDVLLLARRNEGLEDVMKGFVRRLERENERAREADGEDEEAENNSGKKRRRG